MIWRNFKLATVIAGLVIGTYGYEIPDCESLDTPICETATIHVTSDNKLVFRHFGGNDQLKEHIDGNNDFASLDNWPSLTTFTVSNIGMDSRFEFEAIDTGTIGGFIAVVTCGQQTFRTKIDTGVTAVAGKFFVRNGETVNNGFTQLFRLYDGVTRTYAENGPCTEPVEPVPSNQLCLQDGIYFPLVSYGLGNGPWGGSININTAPELEGSYWVWDMMQFVGASGTHTLHFVLDLSCKNPPTLTPTRNPTKQPTTTKEPTRTPTTKSPTKQPTTNPTTKTPTKQPTRQPTQMPRTKAPTQTPTGNEEPQADVEDSETEETMMYIFAGCGGFVFLVLGSATAFVINKHKSKRIPGLDLQITHYKNSYVPEPRPRFQIATNNPMFIDV